MDGFVGALPFTFQAVSSPHMFAGLIHDGFPPSEAGGPADVSASFEGPGIIEGLIHAAYELYLEGVFENHSVAYSDAHLHADEHFFAEVTYTYEPTASVPEPGSAALAALGLGVLGVARHIRSQGVSPRR